MQNLSHTNNLDTCCIVIKSSEMTRMHHNSLANFEKKKPFRTAAHRIHIQQSRCILCIIRPNCEKDLFCRSWSNLEGIFSKGSWTRRLLLYPEDQLGRTGALVDRPSRANRASFLLFLAHHQVLYPAKGREAPWNPTCFQQGPLAPLRGIYRTTLGLMANLRGPFPPRWALTAGLLTTESLDHSSTVSTARLAFRRPRHCSFFLFAPVQECARSSCFTLLRISFLSTEISSRGGDAWKEER